MRPELVLPRAMKVARAAIAWRAGSSMLGAERFIVGDRPS